MDNIERMRRAREEKEFKKAMTERGYVPGKTGKQMVHAIEKTPLQTKKDLAYARRNQGPPRAPEESTLHKGIHNIKSKRQLELEAEEPTFHPEINPSNKLISEKK